MAGLMDTQQGAPPPADTRDPATLTDESDAGGEMASPEEQAQYEQAANNLASLLYAEGAIRPELLEAFQVNAQEPPAAPVAGEEAPTEGAKPSAKLLALSKTAVDIVTKVDDSAREAGTPLSNDVLTQIATDSVELLVEAVEAAGVQEYSEDEMAGALANMFDMYRPKIIADGRATEEELNAEWEGLLQADKAGKLNEYVGQDITQQQPQA